MLTMRRLRGRPEPIFSPPLTSLSSMEQHTPYNDDTSHEHHHSPFSKSRLVLTTSPAFASAATTPHAQRSGAIPMLTEVKSGTRGRPAALVSDAAAAISRWTVSKRDVLRRRSLAAPTAAAAVAEEAAENEAPSLPPRRSVLGAGLLRRFNAAWRRSGGGISAQHPAASGKRRPAAVESPLSSPDDDLAMSPATRSAARGGSWPASRLAHTRRHAPHMGSVESLQVRGGRGGGRRRCR